MYAILPRAVASSPYPVFSQYCHLTPLFNPAASGNSDFARINIAGRFQWIRFDGYPKYLAFVADAPFTISGKHIGASLSVLNSNILNLNSTDYTLGGSYSFKLPSGSIAPGIAISYSRSTVRKSGNDLPSDTTTSKAKFSVGLMYAISKLQIGTSFMSGETGVAYIYIGTAIDLPASDFDILPSAICQTDFKSSLIEVTACLRYKSFLSIGTSCRFSSAVGIIAAIERYGLRLSYVCTLPVANAPERCGTSHELCLGYAFKINKSVPKNYKKKSIRLM